MDQTKRLHLQKNVFIILIVFVLSITNSAFASPFILRNGIKWFMTKDQVKQSLKSEPNFDSYIIADESNDTLRDMLYRFSPNEKSNPKLWCIFVTNLSLGNASEDVYLYMTGTKEHGLYTAFYEIVPHHYNEPSLYNRAKDLTSQLSKKYGKLNEDDHWKNRGNKKDGDYLYESWIELDDGTFIYLHLKKYEGNDSLAIEYQSARMKEIEQSIKDGTLYIDTAFGL